MEVSMNNRFRLLTATALALLASVASAQSPDPGRGNTPPGMSRDGAGPGEGAITGGSIAPGERGGREDVVKRCHDLEGLLREQCLRNADSAGSGSTSAPAGKAPMGGSDIEPRVAPPPQNPR
jgi:hypothetical protein